MAVHSGSFYCTLEGTTRGRRMKVDNVPTGFVRKTCAVFSRCKLSLCPRDRPGGRRKGTSLYPFCFLFPQVRKVSLTPRSSWASRAFSCQQTFHSCLAVKDTATAQSKEPPFVYRFLGDLLLSSRCLGLQPRFI